MKVILLTRDYLHKPDLREYLKIKNAILHRIVFLRLTQLHSIPKTDVRFYETFEDILMGLGLIRKRSHYERFLKKYDFPNTLMNATFDVNKPTHRKNLFEFKNTPILKEGHMMLLLITINTPPLISITIDNCNLNDYFLSMFVDIDLSKVTLLNLNNNNLTNTAIKHLCKTNLSNRKFLHFKINNNNINEEALTLIFSSNIFKNLVRLSLIMKEEKMIKNGKQYEIPFNYNYLLVENIEHNTKIVK